MYVEMEVSKRILLKDFVDPMGKDKYLNCNLKDSLVHRYMSIFSNNPFSKFLG